MYDPRPKVRNLNSDEVFVLEAIDMYPGSTIGELSELTNQEVIFFNRWLPGLINVFVKSGEPKPGSNEITFWPKRDVAA